jgi:DNA-binding helix-hairpin-helix protein with protein kinase domain
MSVNNIEKSSLFSLTGHPLLLGPRIGSGGEGAVYELRDRSDVVAKLYHKHPEPDKSAKIAAMAKFGNERLLKLTAWPIEPIRGGSKTGPILGFVMPKITAHKEAFSVYSPKLRVQEARTVNWQFLIRSATNAARAFSVVHDSGHVIGDVNDGNILIGEKATVRLIDCDSYQINLNGSLWRCEVGRPEYQPSELQNTRTYKQAPRTTNHDRFGLAVIIFRILFMGRHPFAGRFLNSGQMPLERAISEYRFVYGSNAAAMQMQPPPASLGLNGVTRNVALLFERAFCAQGSKANARPRPDEWVTALDGLERHLKRCGANPAHQFVDSLTHCPWCEIETVAGIPLFQVVVVGSAQTGFTIASFWAKVSSVPEPGPPPSRPRIDAVTVTPSSTAQKVQDATLKVKLSADLSAVTQLTSHVHSLRTEIETKAANARSRWQNLVLNWDKYSSASDFQDALSSLQHLRSQYDAVPQKRLQELHILESNRYRLQLSAHLDRCRISHARIKGIGAAKKAMLQSYGIETAADIIDHRVLEVPGFGPVLLDNLQQWREQQQKRFKFDLNKGVDQTAKNAVEQKMLSEKIHLEKKLNDALAQLTNASFQVRTRRRALVSQAKQASQDLAQAEEDLRVVTQATRDLVGIEAGIRAAEQAARDRAEAEAAQRAAERATRDHAEAARPKVEQVARDLAEADTPILASVASRSWLSGLPYPPATIRKRATIFAIGAAVAIGGFFFVASHQAHGPLDVTPQQPPGPQGQQLPPRPAQPSLPPHVEKDARGELHPEDGYEWSDGKHVNVRWIPGRDSRRYSHIAASDTEGKWQPEDGYDWVDGANPNDKTVKWVPGIGSDRYPNVVAASIEGQWRPAEGYTWLLNPPRPGDLRVTPIARPDGQLPSPEERFQRGLADRTEWEQWVAVFSGEFRRGADWWAAHRNLPHAGTCNGPAAVMNQQFTLGCEAAKARLTSNDVKHKSDPDYRRGWNSYAGSSSPPSPESRVPTAEQSTASEGQATDADAAKRLNEEELKRILGH